MTATGQSDGRHWAVCRGRQQQTPLFTLATLPQNFPWVWDPEDLRIRPT